MTLAISGEQVLNWKPFQALQVHRQSQFYTSIVHLHTCSVYTAYVHLLLNGLPVKHMAVVKTLW